MLGKDISIYKCARDLIKKRGLLSLYTGFTPQSLQHHSVGLSLANYQYLKRKDNILSNSL